MSDYFAFLQKFLPLLLTGAVTTLKLLVCSIAVSFLLGSLFGVLMCKRVRIPIIAPLVEVITFILRGVPFFVQLLIVYYVLPDLLGYNIALFPASVIALGVCSSGYVAQLVRGAINAISPAQWEMAFVLGFGRRLSLRYIILPQVFRLLLPSLNNEVEGVLKSTAIVSSIGMLELTRMGMNIVSRELDPVPVYLTVAAIYLCMSIIFNLFSRFMERKWTLC